MGQDEPSDVFAARRRKLEALRAAGIDPFPHAFDGVEPIADVREALVSLDAGEESEAVDYAAGAGELWASVPGALAWLES